MYPFQVSHPNEIIEEKLEEHGISPLLSRVLSARGVTSKEEAEAVLYPTSIHVHSPFLLDNMDLAVERIHTAMANNEKIAIYGDYDVDGITSTSLLTHYLAEKGADVVAFIPERMGEGYGLHEISLEDLFRDGIRLVITVDCGISAIDQVDFSNALGMDIIITDHHSCPDRLPKAYAVINPRLGNYPFPHLAGVGVALKLAQALEDESQWEPIFHRYSDLVAVGTVADVMTMQGENRYFVREGLKKLNENPRLAFSMLLQETGLEGRLVTVGTIGYTIAPRINAAGRLDQTQIALDLLLTTDVEEARSLVQHLCELNIHRQGIEGTIYQNCLDKLEEKPPESQVFLFDSQWHPGVVGIVASRLAEHFKVPAIMICCRDGIGKGSCRTLNKLNLYEALSECSDLLLGFGGHAQAAGFTIAEENIPLFQEKMNEIAKRHVIPNPLRLISIDARVEIQHLTLDEVSALTLLEPSGIDCLRPSFLLEKVEVIGASLVGGGKHLRLRLKQNEEEISGIYFYYNGDPIYIGAFLDVAFYLQENNHKGKISPQLRIISMTLTRETDGFYQKWKRGGQISPEEALHLYPNLEEFESIYQYFAKIQGDSPMLLKESSIHRLCLRLEQEANLPYAHGEVCLAILRERGKVEIKNNQGETTLFLKDVEKSSPLEMSPILQYLSPS